MKKNGKVPPAIRYFYHLLSLLRVINDTHYIKLGTDEINRSNNLRHSKIRLGIRIDSGNRGPLEVSWKRKIWNIVKVYMPKPMGFCQSKMIIPPRCVILPKSQLCYFYRYHPYITAFLVVSKPVVNSRYLQFRLTCDKLEMYDEICN